MEELPKKTFLSPSDQFCEELYSMTTKRNIDGRYIVSLPFKKNFVEGRNIGLFRQSAMAQYFRNEARLLRNPQFKKEYDDVIEEYKSLGHMSEIPSPIDLKNSNHYYMPHHAVVKPDSTTTKVRVVFNESSSTSNGISLNDVLHRGPVLQTDIVVLIIMWRFFRYVFNGDITKMYRQILVNPEHTRFQRNKIIQDFELRTVTFWGKLCAIASHSYTLTTGRRCSKFPSTGSRNSSKLHVF